jgi:hypothetical protein
MFIVVKMSKKVYSFANTYLLLARGEHFGGVGKIQNEHAARRHTASF